MFNPKRVSMHDSRVNGVFGSHHHPVLLQSEAVSREIWDPGPRWASNLCLFGQEARDPGKSAALRALGHGSAVARGVVHIYIYIYIYVCMSHGQNTRRPLYQGGVRFCITHAKTMQNDKVSPKNGNP